MAVQNRIIKIQKRNRALVTFDESHIREAVLRAAETIGGMRQDFLPGINEKIFDAHGSDAEIAQFLADAVVVGLNANPHHLIANFPPTIETIQDVVLQFLCGNMTVKKSFASSTDVTYPCLIPDPLRRMAWCTA